MEFNLNKLLQLSKSISLRRAKEKDRFILMKRSLIVMENRKMLKTLASWLIN